MSTKNKNANVKNNSNNIATVEIEDATTTKGKISTKFNLIDQTTTEENLLKVDKNQLFSVELSDYFCPVKFDSSKLEESLNPLVLSGILSEDAKAKAIETAKREFLALHEKEINDSQNLSFAEVVAKLQENETLYKKVLSACNVSELRESNYIDNGKVKIFRANQFQDKEGNNRYTDATLSKTENNNVFSQSLFVEYREITTSNVLLAIRYYQSYLDAAKRLLNKVSDYKRILTFVYDSAKRAKENGFSIEQITNEVKKVFEESTDETK